MKENTNISIEEFEKRLASSEKRIDDIKWFIGGFTGFFTIIISLITIVANMNLNSERADLREDLRDFKSELGKVEIPPQLELLGPDKKPLAHQILPVTYQVDEKGNHFIVLTHLLRNVGKSLSGPLYEKFYSKDPIELYSRSTDEPKFEYETYYDPRMLSPNEIPGGYSTEWRINIQLQRSEKPPPGKYPVLIKVFFGKGDVVQSLFWIEISAQ